MAGIRILRWTVRTGLVFPMMGFAGYVVAAAASSGNDMVSGALLGAGLLATVTEMRTSRRTEAASLQRPPVPAA
jgi:energy-converting hydrogenase Eha subunit C